jgi:hypothetical protein
MTISQRLFTVVGVVNALMILWSWSTYRQYHDATDRFLDATEVASGLTHSDRFDPAMMDVEQAQSWMFTANEIMHRTWNWTGIVLAGSAVVLVIYWILQGKKRGWT